MDHHCGGKTCQIQPTATHMFCECDCEVCEANTEKLATAQSHLEKKAKIQQFHHRVARMLRCRNLDAPGEIMKTMNYEVIRCLAGMNPEWIADAFATLDEGVATYNRVMKEDRHDDRN